MKSILLIIGFVLLVGTASATASYDVPTNTITLTGSNYPWTIYSDVSNSTAYNRVGNTSTLTAIISMSSGSSLDLSDETFIFNCTTNGEYHITGGGASLTASYANITSLSPSAKGYIFMDKAVGNAPPLLNLNHNTISYLGMVGETTGGITVRYYANYNIPVFHNNTVSNCYQGFAILSNQLGGTITNNTVSSFTSNGLTTSSSHGVTISNNTIHSFDGALTYGIYYYAGHSGIISYNTVHSFTGNAVGIKQKETMHILMYNNTVYDGVGKGLQLWKQVPTNWHSKCYNNNITNCTIGIHDGGAYDDQAIVYVYNNSITGGTTAIEMVTSINSYYNGNTITNPTGYSFKYDGNGVATNLTFKNNVITGTPTYSLYYPQSGTTIINTPFTTARMRYNLEGGMKLINSPISGTITWSDASPIEVYHFHDVLVKDATTGLPIDGATVTITNEVDNSSYPAINIAQPLVAYNTATTGSDGHTPLPMGNESTTFALLDYVQNSTAVVSHTYTIGAAKAGYTNNNSAITGLNLTDDYYRTTPNTYQNTSTIFLTSVDTTKIYGTGGDSWSGTYDSNITVVQATNNLELQDTVPGFISKWRFDNSSLLDENETNNNDGTNNGATYNSSGKWDGAFEFNSTESDHITISDSPELDGVSNMAWSFNVYPYSQGVTKAFISKYTASSGARSWGIRNGGVMGEIDLIVSSDGETYTVVESSGFNLQNNTWTHIGVRFVAGEVYFYKNKQYISTGTATGHTSIFGGTADVYIGRYTTRYYDGLLDDVRIYGELSTDELNQTADNKHCVSGNITINYTSWLDADEELANLSYNGSTPTSAKNVDIYADDNDLSYTVIQANASTNTKYGVSGNTYEYGRLRLTTTNASVTPVIYNISAEKSDIGDSAPDTGHSVSGTIYGANGLGEGQVTVTLSSDSTTTSSSGAYSFTGVSAGTYTLTASKPGLQDASTTIIVSGDTTQDLTMALAESPDGGGQGSSGWGLPFNISGPISRLDGLAASSLVPQDPLRVIYFGLSLFCLGVFMFVDGLSFYIDKSRQKTFTKLKYQILIIAGMGLGVLGAAISKLIIFS